MRVDQKTATTARSRLRQALHLPRRVLHRHWAWAEDMQGVREMDLVTAQTQRMASSEMP